MVPENVKTFRKLVASKVHKRDAKEMSKEKELKDVPTLVAKALECPVE